MNNESQNPSDELEKRLELLDKEWDELLKRNLSNTENLTKYVFSLSSGGLGVSLVVVKDLNFLSSANFKWMLFLSWGMFLFTIICALISFLTSLRAIDKDFTRIDQEYAQQNGEEVENERNLPNRMTKVLRYLFVVSCILGLLFTPLFIALNIFRTYAILIEIEGF